MPGTDSMITRIQALLAQAENPGATDAEAEAFTEKATLLMARYSIDKAIVKAAERKAAPEDAESIQVDLSEVTYSHRKASLISAIASVYGCKVVQYSMPGYRAKQLSHVVIVGFRSDLTLTTTLYNSLVVQAEQAQARQAKNAPPYENMRTWRTAWWHGFTTRISRRLYATQEQAKKETPKVTGQPGTELILRDRIVAVTAKYQEMFPNVRTVRSTYRRSAGYGEGRTAADNASLGGSEIGGRRSLSR
jgi:hypothetical protein